MPDTTTDLAALTAQVKALGGDLNRLFELSTDRFEQFTGRVDQLSGRVDQLSKHSEQLRGRLDTLTVTRKVSVHFDAALGGSWIGGTMSPEFAIAAGSTSNALGFMDVALPNLSRIQAVRMSVRLPEGNVVPFGHDQPLDLTTNFFVCEMRISLLRNRHSSNEFGWEPVFVLGNPFRPDNPGEQRVVTIGKDLVDSDLFRYFVMAQFSVKNPGPPSLVVPQGAVVVNSFEVDCIVA